VATSQGGASAGECGWGAGGRAGAGASAAVGGRAPTAGEGERVAGGWEREPVQLISVNVLPSMSSSEMHDKFCM
jgi:hypothetical protein